MAEWKKVVVSGSSISQLDNDAGYLTSATVGSFVSGSDAAARTSLNSLTSGELSQLENIGTSTISATQWGYLGATNQGVATTDSVTFAGVSGPLTGNVTGNVSGNVTGNVTGDLTGTADTASYVAAAGIDGKVATAGTADSASVLATARSFTTTGDVVLASQTFDGSANFTTTATIQAGAVENTMFAANAKTSITGAFTAASAALASDIADLTAATYDLDVAADSGTGNITNAETFTFTGGNAITTTMSGNELTIAGAAGLVSGSGQVTELLPSGVISSSDFTSPSQGTVRATINGVDADVDTGLQTGDSPTFASLTLTGNLTVQGTTTSLQTTNVNVEDKFILVNSGSSAADGGLVVNGAGTSFGWDNDEGRWAFDAAGATWNQTTITSDAFAAAVVTTDDAKYRYNGNIRVTSGEIYIYVE